MARQANAPYRGGPKTRTEERGPREGLVEELIRQFADPLAFYRELIQNSIDAGAKSIVVDIAWEGDDAGLVVRVRDDGSGMSREILEQELTVLFRSGKEGREDAIGKFGVGFVSVLALDPDVVAVTTSEGKGVEWSLHLHADQRFDVFRSAGGEARGTTVALHLKTPAEELEAFVEGSRRALERWCRHAEIPIHLVVRELGSSGPRLEARVDRPFAAEGAIRVLDERDGGRMRVAASLGPEAYLGFFKRGLLLYESHTPPFPNVSVKVMDERLEHTLSRDDIRRDAHHARAMDAVTQVVRGPLARAIHDALHRAALETPERWPELAADASTSALLDPPQVRVPLLSPVAGHDSVDLATLSRQGGLRAYERSPLATAAASAGRLVIGLPPNGEDGDTPPDERAARRRRASQALHRQAAALSGRPLPWLSDALLWAEPEALAPSDHALLDLVATLLGQVHRKPGALSLVTCTPEGSRLGFTGRGEPPVLLETEETERDPFRRFRRPPLFLDAAHPIVRAARRVASSRPRFAASLLARAILLERDLLGREEDAEWLDAALRAAGEGP